MKHRSIRGVAHNFVHSFMSYPNQIARGPVCEALYDVIRERRGAPIVIDWLQRGAEDAVLPADVLAAVNARRRALPNFLKRHGIAREALAEFRTEITSDAAHQIHVHCHVVDDAGNAHRKLVKV